MHFFSPANVMRLLEVVRGEKTAKPVLATAMKLAKTDRQGRASLVGVCHGFVGNRMLAQRQREAQAADPGRRDAVGRRPRALRFRHADGAVRDERSRRARHRLVEGDVDRPRRSAKSCASRTAAARRPAPASTTTTRTATRKPSPMVEKIILDFAAKQGHQPARRSPTRKSWSAASIRWSTRARRSSRRARRSAPPTSISSGSTATAGRSIAAARCSGPTRSASTRCWPR